MVDNLIATIVIYYYPDENVFKTATNQTILNFYPLVTPNQVFLFKKEKKSVEIINHTFGIRIKMLYPIKEENDGTSKMQS